jgi:hypothetical protein
MLSYLAKSAQVEIHFEDARDRDYWRACPWLVDSLCLEAGAAHLVKSPGALGVLIAHYLECLDPCRCNSARTAAELNLLQPYSAAVTTSRFTQSALVAARFRGPVEVISPGLASAYRKRVRRRAGLRKPIIITVASVTPGKGFTKMLCGLERLAHVDWSWQIAGDLQLDRAFAQDFRARVESSPVGSRIAIRGALRPSEVIAAYDQSDIFAIASHFETCGMATMEAIARGCRL